MVSLLVLYFLFAPLTVVAGCEEYAQQVVENFDLQEVNFRITADLSCRYNSFTLTVREKDEGVELTKPMGLVPMCRVRETLNSYLQNYKVDSTVFEYRDTGGALTHRIMVNEEVCGGRKRRTKAANPQ